MKPIKHAIRWLRDARIALGQRQVYRSSADVLKTIILRRRTTAGPVGKQPVPEWALRLRALADPVYCRLDTSDFLVLSEIFEQGEYAQVAGWSLPPDAAVIDLGGNIGLASLYFSSLLPRMRGIVVEPDANNCAMIRQNCRGLIDAGRLQVMQAFVAADDGSAGIDRSGRSWAFKKVEPSASADTIPCISMPSILNQSSFDQIDLLKCDVEGSERELFADCSAWIQKVRHLIVETHMPYSPQHLYDDLRRAGFQFEVVSEQISPTVGVSAMRRV